MTRRADVVGIHPNDAALLRLATSLLVEQDDEWLIQKRYLSPGSLAALDQEPSAGSPTTTSQRYMRARWPSSESPPRKGTVIIDA